MPSEGPNVSFNSNCVLPAPNNQTINEAPPSYRTSIKSVPASLDITQRLERKLAQYNASQNIFKRWLFEIASVATSAVCMGAIIAILAVLKDKPLGTLSLWLTAVTVLSKIASAALILPISEAIGQLKWSWFYGKKRDAFDFEVFDKASRGAWGSFLLLLRTKGKSLAALGALLTVLLLAIDTFFQQVTDTPDRWKLEDLPATIPRTVWYEPKNIKVFESGVESIAADDKTRFIANEFSFANGSQPLVYGNGTRPSIPLSCPTSNCTWPIYNTLGVCSQCTDASSLLTFACLEDRLDWSSANRGGDIEKTPKGKMCGYFLNLTDEKPVMMTGYQLPSNASLESEILIGRILPLEEVISKFPFYGNGSVHFKHLRNTIADVIITSAPDGDTDSVLQHKPPIAHECVLSWCVKTLQSSYSQGKYTENVLSISQNTTSGIWPWISTPFNDSRNGDSGADIFYLDNIHIDGEAIPAQAVDTTQDANGSQQKLLTGFGTSNDSAVTMIHSFVDIFPSCTVAQQKTGDPYIRFKMWRRNSFYYRIPNFNPWLAPNNIPEHMERLATAISDRMRTGEDSVSGSAYIKEYYISVHWEWLTFPLIMLSLSIIFLVATMIKTSKVADDSMGAWKTSAMPTLIYGLPSDTRHALSESSTWGKNSASGAKKVKIRLKPNQGWRVSGQACNSPIVGRQDHPQTPSSRP